MKTIKIDVVETRRDIFMENMLLSNEISGLLKFNKQASFYVYEIDGLKNFSELGIRELSYEKMGDLFNKLNVIVKRLEEFMIEEDNLDFSMERIYFDDKENLNLMLLPQVGGNRDIKSFFWELLQNFILDVDSKSKEIIEILNYFNTKNYSLEGLLNKYFTKDEIFIENHGTIINTSKDCDRIILEEQQENTSSKPSYFEGLKSLFKKKDYKVKSLNIDFKLPKNNS